MTGWTAKRFWTAASVVAVPGGYTVQLDARAVKTPAKAPLVVPTEGLAQAVAAEWDAQEKTVRPETMPYTRTANSAIDKVAPQRAEVVAMLAEYGDSDLLCYRADAPPDLCAHQAALWDPLLDWAEAAHGARLAPVAGVMHRPQDPAALAALRAPLDAMDPFRLSAFHDLVAISGSLVIALAVVAGRITADEGWTLSRVDEAWQIALWGEDEEAAEVAARKRADFLQAARFYALCG